MNTLTKLEIFNASLMAKNYSDRTIEQYSSIIKKFIAHHKKSPVNITSDEIVIWLSRLKSSSSKRQYVGALRNFYKYVIGQPQKFKRVPYPKKEKKIPQVMSQEVVVERIRSISNRKHKMIVSVLYGAGLRLSELLNLRLTDIDGNRNTLFVRHGKGGKDRCIPVSEKLIQDLREYYRQYRPKKLLFEGQFGGRYSETSVQNICRKHMKCNPHLLRHANLTHLIESGVHISEVAKRAGHSKISTTHDTYSHIATTFNPITLLAA